MQYALMKVADNHMILIDALELQSLNRHKDNIQDVEEKDEENLPFKVVYGSYQPQVGKTVEDALKDIEFAKNKWLGFIKGDQCFKIGLSDIKVHDPVQKKNGFHIPFSALISTHVDVNHNSRKSVSAFVRFGNLSIADNVANRGGILAINAQENRIKNREVNEENWLEFEDTERAILSASKVY